MTGDQRHAEAVEAAIRFVTEQTGGPARILTRHHRLPDAYCSGCLASHTRWPCVAAAIAAVALSRGSS